MKCRTGYACPAHVLADGDQRVPCGLLQAGELEQLRELVGAALSAPDVGIRRLARAHLAVFRQLEDAERRAAGHETLTRAAELVVGAHERASKSWPSIERLDRLLRQQMDDRTGRCFGSEFTEIVTAERIACTRCEATFPAPERATTAPIPVHAPERRRQ